MVIAKVDLFHEEMVMVALPLANISLLEDYP